MREVTLEEYPVCQKKDYFSMSPALSLKLFRSKVYTEIKWGFVFSKHCSTLILTKQVKIL